MQRSRLRRWKRPAGHHTGAAYTLKLEAEIGSIEADLPASADEGMIALTNGWACWTMGADLFAAIGDVLDRSPRPDPQIRPQIHDQVARGDLVPVSKTVALPPDLAARLGRFARVRPLLTNNIDALSDLLLQDVAAPRPNGNAWWTDGLRSHLKPQDLYLRRFQASGR